MHKSYLFNCYVLIFLLNEDDVLFNETKYYVDDAKVVVSTCITTFFILPIDLS